MNNKYLIFGAVILAVALVSAAVYSYISNTATVEVSVEYPFTSGFYDGSEVVETLDLGNIYGGDTFSFENRFENRGDSDTNVYLQYRISNSINDVTADDFSNVNIDVRSDGMGNYHFFDGTFNDLCSFSTAHGTNTCIDDSGDLVLEIPNFFFANEKAEIFADLTFDMGVTPADYTISSTVLIR